MSEVAMEVPDTVSGAGCPMTKWPCLLFQQASLGMEAIPMFWKLMAVFHGTILITYAVTLWMIAASMNQVIATDVKSREVIISLLNEHRGRLTSAIKSVEDQVQVHRQLTMENRTVQTQILGVLLREDRPRPRQRP